LWPKCFCEHQECVNDVSAKHHFVVRRTVLHTWRYITKCNSPTVVMTHSRTQLLSARTATEKLTMEPPIPKPSVVWRWRREGLTHALRRAVKVFLRCFRTPSQDCGSGMTHGG
jgi:hypothetical protein